MASQAQVSVDRFSELPLEMAHHILSFLSIADVIRVSSLSKTCKGLHLSNPILTMDSFPFTLTSDKRLELFNSLDRFLVQRGNNKVESFIFEMESVYQHGETEIESHCSFEKSRILSWIQNVVDHCNVEELHVVFESFMSNPEDYSLDVKIDFPACIFLCQSLSYLNLQMDCAILKAPSFSTCPPSNLVHLILTHVTIEDGEGFCKWVSYCCRFIKELRLALVSGLDNITVQSSSLEYFWVHSDVLSNLVISGDRIQEVYIDWEYDVTTKQSNKSLNISAPNLKCLTWIGNMLDHQHLGQVNCLEKLVISLTCYDVNDLDSVCEQFLCSIRSVKVLFLDAVTAKTLFRKGFRPAPLSNVCDLLMFIRCSIDDNLVPAMTSLFRAVPNLIYLNVSSSSQFPIPLALLNLLGCDDNISGSDGGCWELQGLDFVSKVEEVIIGLNSGCNGFELARYMLEHARNLKKLSVITTPDDQSSSIPDIWRSNPSFNSRVVFVEEDY
ncbi:PREDICTED: F-box/FBD/LRR-repeat protein At1g80470-like [Fragaria vesca subsp. vesca]|uniref:F-box/FBD/LRR-repeat protein At1g80470-like n=1 Tax=Fragaria vesca subsp. vesca TaxID=101020 RepID=UPI0002C35A61|nr:PREDICTED: F-box/FBD/LRR-repeat protein At1g80470-like [Fragaria vesca subsp. vesca]